MSGPPGNDAENRRLQRVADELLRRHHAKPAPPPGPTRRQRRARAAQTRAKNRAELRHQCALDKAAEQAGVHQPVGLSLDHFHAVHRALGEATCPRCPRCDKRQPVTCGKTAALEIWGAELRKALGEQPTTVGVSVVPGLVGMDCDAELAAEIERHSWQPGPNDEELR